MSDGYSIMTRENSRLTKLTGKCVISSGGMQADYKTLHKVLQARIVMYKHKMKKDMNTISVSQLLSNTLYGRRFFPYYAFNVVGGVDEEGVGAAFGYDAVGSFERVPYAVTGSGSALITSLLDNQVAFKTQPGNFRDLSVEETLDLVKDCFTCAGERDIYTGDKVQICIITKDGIKEEVLELKRD